jgi:hypothetical protein
MHRLSEEQIIKLLFETIELYNKYRYVYGREEKVAKYAAACQSLSNLKEKKKKKPARTAVAVKV